MKPLNLPIVDWANKSVWLIGASSGIGMACALELASLGAKVAVSARSMEALNAFVRDHSSGIAVDIDVMNINSIEKAFNVVKNHQGIDVVIYCAGHYLEQSAAQYNLAEMIKHNDINYLGLCRVLSYILPPLRAQGYGHIGIISSVAGYQGLPKSLAYGPTKAALINLSESLYFDLHELGIGVSLINPGFVQTPLTAQNNFHMPALISADVAAREMIMGWRKGDFEIHYPKRFTRVLKLLKLFPYALYFKLIKSATKQSKV
jgi:short-subunit dehydrogenase